MTLLWGFLRCVNALALVVSLFGFYLLALFVLHMMGGGKMYIYFSLMDSLLIHTNRISLYYFKVYDHEWYIDVS